MSEPALTAGEFPSMLSLPARVQHVGDDGYRSDGGGSTGGRRRATRIAGEGSSVVLLTGRVSRRRYQTTSVKMRITITTLCTLWTAIPMHALR